MHFEKVPFKEYLKTHLSMVEAKSDTVDDKFEEWLRIEWENIRLPARATAGSAGYDFYLPADTNFTIYRSVLVPTGIRVQIDEPDWFLMLLPRSGLGFKYGFHLDNTCGVIDSDYYYADNYGHIMAKISVDKDVFLQKGDRFMQGILMPYGLMRDDMPTAADRHGGFGSTGN